MTYIINPMWFYWLQLVDVIRMWILIFAAGSFVMTVVFFGFFAGNMEWHGIEADETQRYWKALKKVLVATVLIAIIYSAIPSKNTLIEMQIARYATVENANWTLETIKSAVDYIVEAIKSMK
jgi:hypothetical protein